MLNAEVAKNIRALAQEELSFLEHLIDEHLLEFVMFGKIVIRWPDSLEKKRRELSDDDDYANIIFHYVSDQLRKSGWQIDGYLLKPLDK